MRIFHTITKMLVNKPARVIIAAVLLIALMVAGAPQIKMATGNETLIDNKSQVFQDNSRLEAEFGGESIIVLHSGTNAKQMLTPDNLRKMKHLETRLQGYDEVYSIISPVTVIEQLTAKQSEKYLQSVQDISNGLETMGGKLLEIGSGIQAKTSSGQQPDLQTMQGQFSQLENALAKMIDGQKQLKQGISQMGGGYLQFGNQTKQIADSMQTMSRQMAQDSASQPMSQQLGALAKQLEQLSAMMNQTSTKSAQLAEVPDKTAQGLAGMQAGIKNQQQTLQGQQAQLGQMKDLAKLANGLIEMGTKLQEISSGLKTLLTYSDIMDAGLPKSQQTMDKLLYDDTGSLREVFKDVVPQEGHMLMIVKLKGNVDDGAKNAIIETIKQDLAANPLDAVQTMVSGKPVLDSALRASMKTSMQKMVLLAIGFMVIVLAFVFRVQWRLLALPVIFAGVVATLGFMGWVGVPMTMVSMAVFPILIGLGVDYAIQFHNRYVEEMN